MTDTYNKMITIKKIKDIIIYGTNVKFLHSEFVRELFVESYLLNENDFEKILLKNNTTFGKFIREGNLRKTSKSYRYAIPKIAAYIKRIIEENGYDYFLKAFYDAYQKILNHIYEHIQGTQPYNQGLYNRIMNLVTQENTYFIELYNEITNLKVEKDSLCKSLSLLTMIAIFQDSISEVIPQQNYKTKWSNNGFFPHASSPYAQLCSVPHSHNDRKNDYRDVYNSSQLFKSDESLKNILEKANLGDLYSMLLAGIFYYYGISKGKDERRAAAWFKRVSEAECEYSPIADKFIARMYYAGSMPREPQSYEKSYKYHVKSAKGDIYSAGQVGFMKTIGSGCPFDYEEIERYFFSILDSLDNPRKHTLCKFYMEYGEFKKAACIYEEMADTYPEAAFQLGLMYKRGVLNTPFKPDYYKAARYFQMAIDNGYTQAAHELGTLYFNPTGGFKKNFVKAQKYYLLSAKTGNVDSQYMLGYMYSYGHVEKNIPLALEYFELAAEQGHVLSATHLALLYQMPEYHNYEKAFRYCKYAADCGDSPAEFVLGTMYLLGRGCEPDEDKAYLCFKHAAENGAPEATVMLELMDELEI